MMALLQSEAELSACLSVSFSLSRKFLSIDPVSLCVFGLRNWQVPKRNVRVSSETVTKRHKPSAYEHHSGRIQFVHYIYIRKEKNPRTKNRSPPSVIVSDSRVVVRVIDGPEESTTTLGRNAKRGTQISPPSPASRIHQVHLRGKCHN